MRVMVNFMLRDVWFVRCITEDARTIISPILRIANQNMLIRALRYVGATNAEITEVDDRIRRWSRGSVMISLTPGRRNLLRIRQPWCDELIST